MSWVYLSSYDDVLVMEMVGWLVGSLARTHQHIKMKYFRL